MKSKSKSIALFIALLLVCSLGYSQMTLTGEIRPRFEYRHGYQVPADTLQKSAQFIQQRTRLNFGYKATDYKVGVTLQDVRVWGSQSQLNTFDVNTFGIHEAWVDYNFTKKVSMKLGRQEISYDDERIMGAVDWTQQGRAHDAMVLKYVDSTFTAHFGLAYNQEKVTSSATSYAVASSYKEMQYLWLNKQINSINLSFLALNVGQQSPVFVNSTRYITTLGTRVVYKKSPWFAGLNFYYQTGTSEDAVANSKNEPKKVSAMLGGFDVAYTVKEKYTIGLGYEYQSGQSQTDTAIAYKDVKHAFNPVFGTNHKFNGYMDYFYVGGQHLNSVGLQDIMFRFKYKVEKWSFAFDLHQFMTAADVLDTKETASSGKITAMNGSLGTELDFTYTRALSAGVNLTAGYSHFLPSETLSTLKNVKNYEGKGRTDETSNWAYIMISFKPNFMK